MTGDNSNMEMSRLEVTEELLKHLFHLKRYETPEVARMTRNKQNIMRHVREVSRSKRKSLGDLLEINFPWFFAEPKYGVALLFVAFAGLQYLGMNDQQAAHSNTGIYTNPGNRFATYEASSDEATNSIDYPEFPRGATLFQQYNDPNVLTPVELPMKVER